MFQIAWCHFLPIGKINHGSDLVKPCLVPITDPDTGQEPSFRLYPWSRPECAQFPMSRSVDVSTDKRSSSETKHETCGSGESAYSARFGEAGTHSRLQAEFQQDAHWAHRHPRCCSAIVRLAKPTRRIGLQCWAIRRYRLALPTRPLAFLLNGRRASMRRVTPTNQATGHRSDIFGLGQTRWFMLKCCCLISCVPM